MKHSKAVGADISTLSARRHNNLGGEKHSVDSRQWTVEQWTVGMALQRESGPLSLRGAVHCPPSTVNVDFETHRG